MAGNPQAKCRVLLVTEEPGFGERWIRELKQVAETDDGSPIRLHISQGRADKLASYLADGMTQIVALDEHSLGDKGLDSCYQQVRATRAEIDCFLLTSSTNPVTETVYEGVLSRAESNYGVVYRSLRRVLLERTATPFADALKEYVFAARDSWHTPGHSSGDSLSSSPWVVDFYRFMGEHMFNTDLSVSVKMLDSLMEPVSVIRNAQNLAAKTFGARHTYYVTNGTSTSNKIVLQYLMRHGDKVIVDRNCHKSVHHAMIMSGSIPVYLESSVNQNYGVYGPVSKARIFAAIDENPEARLLILTSCTYDGMRYDLKPIIEYAHAHNIRVLIDEAWYAHGRFHPEFRPTALECGADFVTHSTHKMLSAFSQASMIHVGHGVKNFDAARFREDINMHTSTSPQYGMIASLDVARKQMSIEGFSVMSRTLGFVQEIRDYVKEHTAFRVLDVEDLCDPSLKDDGIRLDVTKVTIDVGVAGMSAPTVQAELFNDYGIQIEKNTHNTLTVLVTIGTTESKVLRLKQALQKISQKAPGVPLEHKHQSIPSLPPMRVLPRTAYFAEGEKLPLTQDAHKGELVARVACDEIVPYPPGIPLVVPGQELTADILSAIANYVYERKDLEMHGVQTINGVPHIRVMRKEAEAEGKAELTRLAGH
ncbi:aminotransferase class I/II-fold pyridoxal phosphate-dependent enzyme [Simiduia agarivorans]|uniref:Arginine decarboxylase n=1 Tax=Simiduia agarivorans (strain DSM 21679 / JCM 13881 / BCRC 17597 / SA1) TaxID=1117647 RepID=K4L051_SIMAS|nr:aminotransferase class V-fold PLP-dependent enzyme [Simiduia agarivorans]AFU99552.2 arginine decarboxylase [Simiduia agarivorans SA1 = DSM 21679]